MLQIYARVAQYCGTWHSLLWQTASLWHQITHLNRKQMGEYSPTDIFLLYLLPPGETNTIHALVSERPGHIRFLNSCTVWFCFSFSDTLHWLWICKALFYQVFYSLRGHTKAIYLAWGHSGFLKKKSAGNYNFCCLLLMFILIQCNISLFPHIIDVLVHNSLTFILKITVTS